MPKFHIGEKVSCYYDDDWYVGDIRSINKNGTYHVVFDDGDVLDEADEVDIRHLDSPKDSPENIYFNQDNSEFSDIDFGLPMNNYELEKENNEYEINGFDYFSGGNADQQENATAGQDINSPMMYKLFSRTEDYLLPSQDERYWTIRVKGMDANNIPRNRLDQVLFQLAIADHLRLMQSLYRDSEDDQLLEPEMRFENANVKISNKALMERITEGRARAVALCRLCYGDETIEVLRATVDLGNSYASQGRWPQVLEHMTLASQRMLSVHNHRRTEAFEEAYNKSRQSAFRVTCVFNTLREHAIKNCGEVKWSFISELMRNLNGIDNTDDAIDQTEINSSQQNLLSSSLMLFFEKQKAATKSNTSSDESINNPSWGDLVDFFRQDCSILTSWVAEVDSVILPQHKALLRVAFQLGDSMKKGIVRPIQYAMYLSRLPAAAKAIAGSQLVKHLTKIEVQVPIFFEMDSLGEIIHIGGTTGQRLEYELPITWEEVLAMNVIECDTDPLDLIRVQISTMMGVCHVFSNKLGDAEVKMQEALKILKRLGMDMEVPACELYNSIAQMMIMKHRHWHAKKRSRCKLEAERRLETEEGLREIIEESRNIRRQAKQNGVLITKEEAQQQARETLLKRGIKHLFETRVDPTISSLEAAYKYLVRTYEILEKVHGVCHPSVASACLAIASVQNVIGDYVEARDWLVKALRLMEKLNPSPIRAIAFVKVQLSQVLSKQNHHQEAIQVLAAAVSTHYERARDVLSKCITMTPRGPVPEIVSPGESAYEDVRTALTLVEKLMIMTAEHGTPAMAREHAESMAELAEAAFGWDSQEAALCWKEVGIRCVAMQDWLGAFVNLKKSLEAHEVCFGDKDNRTYTVNKLLLDATTYLANSTSNGHKGGGGEERKNVVVDYPNNDSNEYKFEEIGQQVTEMKSI